MAMGAYWVTHKQKAPPGRWGSGFQALLSEPVEGEESGTNKRENTMPFIRKYPLGVNDNPTGLDTLIKRAVLSAYVRGLLSVDQTQHLINRFQLWSA